MKKITGALCFFLGAQILSAQVNSKMQEMAAEIVLDKSQHPHYISLKPETRITVRDASSAISSMLFENQKNSVVSSKTEIDELGYTHIRYQVTQDGYPVGNQVLIGHFKNGVLVSINGDLSEPATPKNGFSLTENQALNGALKKINASKYKWENAAEEQHMKAIFNDPDFSYYPKGTKVLKEKDGRMYCAYMFNIYADAPLYRANVFVNAATGEVIEEQSLICNADVPATAVTKYSGTQPFTNDFTGSLYRLRETQRGLGIETYNCKNTTSYAQTDFTNTATSWTSTGVDQGATDAHWGAEMTYDYYMTQHNRNSINNNGFKLVSYVHYSTGYTNAFWDGQRMTYGDGNGSSMKIFTTLDICGHEISHGLTSNSAGLIYSNESGALNESYSDIFGTSIENYARPTNWNWKIGEDMTSGAVGLRTMANPSSFGDPDTYGGANYYTGTADNGGVHTNSGVSNFWYYLLTMGGTGTNDLGNAYAVTGLGFTKAAKIAFRALTVYYTPTTNFATARNLSIQAAKDLYGSCSQEVISTMNAWHAVGVGAAYVPGLIGPNFIANSTNFCYVPAQVNFTNTTINGISYSWDFGDGTSSTSTNTAHTYTASGNYNVRLIANGCNSGIDSIIKSSYITVNISTPPVTSDVDVCMNNSATLSATSNGTLTWYDDPGSANIGTGNTFITPAIQTNTTYYVSSGGYAAPVFGGMASNTGGGYFNSTAPYLVFNVSQSSVLNSVVVYAIGAGTRVFQLRSATNTILSALSVSLAAGANTVNLNFILTPGNNYRLGLSTSSGTGLYRSTTGVSYPYNVGNLVDITTSSTGNSSYFWFYNWKVTKAFCTSSKVAVNINVNPLPDVSMLPSQNQACADDEVLLTGSPSGGSFSGSGVNGSSFNASTLGAGTYPVMYTYTDLNNCTNSYSVNLFVEECTGVKGFSNDRGIVLYPNPLKDRLEIRTQTAGNASVMDGSGRLVAEFKLETGSQSVDLSGLAKGMYILNLKNDAGILLHSAKLVKE